jgi:hypothetical protein
MGKIDPQQERERLAALYAGMSDLELEKTGKDPAVLTDWAFEMFRAEMAKRRLEWAGADMPLPSLMEKRVAPDESGNTPVVLRKYRDMPAAITDRMILEAAGIDCYLYNENMVRLDWMWSNLLGGLRLVVRQSELEDAEKLLESKPGDKFTVEGVGDYEQERCRKCGSDDISCDELLKKIAGIGLLLGLPIAITHRGWNCRACGHSWEVTKDGESNPAEK